MPDPLRYVVYVDTSHGETVTALTLPTVDEATKLRQIADDLGLVLTEMGCVPNDPDVRRISVKHKQGQYIHRWHPPRPD